MKWLDSTFIKRIVQSQLKNLVMVITFSEQEKSMQRYWMASWLSVWVEAIWLLRSSLIPMQNTNLLSLTKFKRIRLKNRMMSFLLTQLRSQAKHLRTVSLLISNFYREIWKWKSFREESKKHSYSRCLRKSPCPNWINSLPLFFISYWSCREQYKRDSKKQKD